MRRLTRSRGWTLGAVLLLLAACDPGIELDPPVEPWTYALFDQETGKIPLPNVVLEDQAAMRMSFPLLPPPGGLAACAQPEVICDDECTYGSDNPCAGAATVYDGALTLELKAQMNELNGFIDNLPITIPFSKTLDPDSLTADTVFLFDLMPMFIRGVAPPIIRPGLQTDEDLYGDGYWRLPSGPGPDGVPGTDDDPPSVLTLKPKAPGLLEFPRPFEAGKRYGVAVTDEARGHDGTPVEADVLLYLLRSRNPLVDQVTGKVLNVLLQGMIDAGLLDLKTVLDLETLRNVYDMTLNHLEEAYDLPREHVPLFFLFTVASNPQPLFVPTSTGTSVSFPDGSNPFPNEYDGSQDPVPADQPVYLYFDPEPLQVVVESDAAVQLYDITGGSPQREARALSVDPANLGRLKLRHGLGDGSFESGHRYAVVVTTASFQGFQAIAGTPYWGIVKARHPLVDAQGEIASIYLDQRLDLMLMLGKNPHQATARDWEDAGELLKGNLAAMEEVRLRLAPLLDDLEAKDPALAREHLALVFSFTVE